MVSKKIINKNSFINEATKIHGIRFDYSQVMFVDEDSPVILKCQREHTFLIVAKIHMQGEGCPTCKELYIRSKIKDSEEDFFSSERKNIFKSFIGEINSINNSINLLEISFSNQFFIEKDCLQLENRKWISKIDKSSAFDFILGEFGYSKREKIYKRGSEKIKVRSVYANILCSLQFLEKNGIALFTVPEHSVSVFGNKKINLESLLNSEGYYLNAIFKPTFGLFETKSFKNFQVPLPIIVLITRKKSSSVFLGELLNEAQSINLVKNYFKKKAEANLKNGKLIANKSFKGFNHEKIEIQIGKLNKINNNFEHFKLKELASEINFLKSTEEIDGRVERTKHKEKGNSIYIKTLSFKDETSFDVLCKASDIPAKHNTYEHHRYVQVVLNEKTTNKYLSSYFKSDFGRLILLSIAKLRFSRIHIPLLEDISIVLPSIENQQLIIRTLNKLENLKEKIDNFNSEIGINLSSTKEISGNVDNMLEILGRLTEADKIHNLIRHGESDKLEFKETLSLDLKKNSKEKYIEESVLKTIVAFLNKEGGILLIGVNDNGLINGIETELKRLWKTLDKLLQHFKNIRRDRIGINFDIYIDIKPIKIDKKTILKVKCLRSNFECYLDEEEFYLRTNPANEKLTGRKLSDYIQERFR